LQTVADTDAYSHSNAYAGAYTDAVTLHHVCNS
jgi:hypothetical protein